MYVSLINTPHAPSPALLTYNGDFEMNINEILEIPKFLNSNSK